MNSVNTTNPVATPSDKTDVGVEATANKADASDNLRFGFGKNWENFLKGLNDDRIKEAEISLQNALQKTSLEGLSFLDIGSGSGLFSLAARRLGATVHSFDYDPESVLCTKYLKERFQSKDPHWQVERGSVLDKNYLNNLGQFDIVYSWGVLHHTGNMYQAFENVSDLLKPNGTLFISIYNDQGAQSKRWTWIKRSYNKSGFLGRFLWILYGAVRLWTLSFIKMFIKTGNPLRPWVEYGKQNRGMSAYYDLVDWIGGYPFEVAKPEEVFEFFKAKGFELVHMKNLCGQPWV